MNFFLGFLLDDSTRSSVQKVVREIGTSFDQFGIPVRWVKPDRYHMSLLFLSNRMPFFMLWYYKFKLKPFFLKRFKIRFNTVKLGISRKYKELIYLDLEEGGEEMRKIFLELRNIFNLKTDSNFIPHLTLGRISKDLTKQEYSNVCKDISRVSKSLGIKEIEFYVSDIKLVKSTEDGYTILFSLSDSSRIKG